MQEKVPVEDVELSLVVVNWNTRDLLRKCLASIEKFPPSCPFEVIVVDNASSDGSAAMVEVEFPWVRLMASKSNMGYARGNNLGFELARGQTLLTLNPDTEFEDRSLDRALEVLNSHPEWACLGIKLIGLDGRVQPSVRGFPTPLGILGERMSLARRFPGGFWDGYALTAFDYESEGLAPQPMGTFLLFRREALEALGPVEKSFDERFPIFFNEVDLLYRLHAAGLPCGYTPRAHVRHVHGAGTRQVRRSMIWESHRSLVRYFAKHLRGFARLWIAPLALVAWLSAWIRARGFDAGFRPQHHDL